jgi:hypothetical protein
MAAKSTSKGAISAIEEGNIFTEGIANVDYSLYAMLLCLTLGQ